jgi:hypothetical protein
LFGVGQRLLTLDQALLDFLSRRGDFLAGLAGGGSQQLFRVPDQSLEIVDELFS